MVLEGIPTGYEIRLLIDIGIVLAAGFAIGAERENQGTSLQGLAHIAL
jgi:hypothetical protein